MTSLPLPDNGGGLLLVLLVAVLLTLHALTKGHQS